MPSRATARPWPAGGHCKYATLSSMKQWNQRLALALIFLAGALPFAAAQSPEIHAHLQKAAAALQAKDPDSAAREFKAVLALDPRNAEANANLGVMAFFHGDYKTAAQYLRTALAADPSLAKSQALLGICENKLRDPSARALLEKSFPKVKEKALRIQAGMALAGIDYQQGNLDDAASVMRSLMDLDPDNIEVLYLAQRIYSELADDTLNKLAIVAPGSALPHPYAAPRPGGSIAALPPSFAAASRRHTG